MIITRSTPCPSPVKTPLTFRGDDPKTENLEECEPLKPHLWINTPTGKARSKQFYAVVETASPAIQANIIGGGVNVKEETPTQPYFFVYVLNKKTKKALEKHLNTHESKLEGLRWEIEVRGRAYAGERFPTLRRFLPDIFYQPTAAVLIRLLRFFGQ